jgi:hypothetical protein
MSEQYYVLRVVPVLWVLVICWCERCYGWYYDGNTFYICDVSNLQYLHADHKTYLSKLYLYLPSLNFKHIQKQSNLFDFGVFAMEFVILIALGYKL